MDNPYFIAYGIRNGFVRDRIFGNISLTYDFTENFSLLVRHSLDRINEGSGCIQVISVKVGTRDHTLVQHVGIGNAEISFIASATNGYVVRRCNANLEEILHRIRISL